MKTLLKNRRAYKTRIGSLDQLEEQGVKKEVDENGEERVSDKEDDDDESWESMYVKRKGENGWEDDVDVRGTDENSNGGGYDDEEENRNDDEGNDGEERNDGESGDEYDKRGERDGDDDDGNGNGGEVGGGDGNGSRMKRKASADEPGTATRAKRKKMDDNGAATQSIKKALPKKKPGKKKN
jgi:hypothetical protein